MNKLTKTDLDIIKISNINDIITLSNKKQYYILEHRFPNNTCVNCTFYSLECSDIPCRPEVRIDGKNIILKPYIKYGKI